MKKTILILSLMIIQSLTYSQSSLGIKAGVTVSDVPKYNYDALVSPAFGLIYTEMFGKFGLTVEPGYNSKGFSANITFTDASGNPTTQERVNYKYNYLELPITIGFYPLNEDLILGVNVGLAPCLLLNAKETRNNTALSANKGNLDFVATGVIGGNISDKLVLCLNFRYGKGLLEIKDSTDVTYNYLSGVLTLSYKLN